MTNKKLTKTTSPFWIQIKQDIVRQSPERACIYTQTQDGHLQVFVRGWFAITCSLILAKHVYMYLAFYMHFQLESMQIWLTNKQEICWCDGNVRRYELAKCSFDFLIQRGHSSSSHRHCSGSMNSQGQVLTFENTRIVAIHQCH